jgi:hypothetical protein
VCYTTVVVFIKVGFLIVSDFNNLTVSILHNFFKIILNYKIIAYICSVLFN